MYVGLLTVEQKDTIKGQLYGPDLFFNPVQDADGNWIISLQEMVNTSVDEFEWVRDLPVIEFKPVIDPLMV
jgi:hypothetical protein